MGKTRRGGILKRWGALIKKTRWLAPHADDVPLPIFKPRRKTSRGRRGGIRKLIKKTSRLAPDADDVPYPWFYLVDRLIELLRFVVADEIDRNVDAEKILSCFVAGERRL